MPNRASQSQRPNCLMDIASALQNHMFKAPVLAGSPFVRSLGVVPVQLAHSFFGFAGRGQKNSEELEPLRTDPSGFLIHHLARSKLRTSLLCSALRLEKMIGRRPWGVTCWPRWRCVRGKNATTPTRFAFLRSWLRFPPMSFFGSWATDLLRVLGRRISALRSRRAL